MLRIELDRLKHKDVRQRRRAVRRLFELDEPTALEGFTDLLDDSDTWFRDKAIEAHRRWISAEHKTMVISLTVHRTASIRQLAAELAPRLGTSALDILSTLCLDDEIAVKRTAWRSRLMVDAGSIPVAVSEEDHVVRCMAIERSGDSNTFEKALADSHVRVRESALKRMRSLSISHESIDALLHDSELGAKAADIRLPELIVQQKTDVIASLCESPSAEMRKALARHLDDVDWFSWDIFVKAVQSSQDTLLLPRLLRSRQGPDADSLRKSLLEGSEQMVRTRILEDLHGRKISEELKSVVEKLVESEDSLVAQTASSLLADISVLQGA